MKKLHFIRDIMPHLVAIITFLVITVSFFKPVFFDNKSLNQHDITQWEGSSKALRDFRAETGEEGLWAPGMFSGMPAYLVNVEWSNGPVLVLKKVLTLGLPHPVSNIFAAFISYYILLLSFRIRPYLAIGGAIAFGLSSYMIIGLAAGHNARIGAIAFMPLVMAGIHLVFSRQRWLGFGVTALGMALHLRENHLQVTYYLMLIVAAYGIVRLLESVREKRILEFVKSVGLLIPAVLISACTFLGPFWAITEYSRYSMRGPSELTSSANSEGPSGLSKSYAFEFSNALTEPMTLMIPNYYGGSSMNFLVRNDQSEVYQALVRSGNQKSANQLAPYTGAYWGPQRLSSPSYAGAIICFLFIVGIVYADRRFLWWLLPLSVLSIILSWGDNFAAFNYFVFDYLPGYNKFRSVTFALIIIIFAMPLLGFSGLQNLLKEKGDTTTLKKLAWPAGLTLGLCIVLGFSGGFGSFLRPAEAQLPVWFTNALRADRIDLFRSDVWRSFWFIIVFCVVVIARMKNWIKDSVFFIIVIVLITLDLTLVDKRYFNEEMYQRKRTQSVFIPNGADKAIMKDKSYYRVYNILDPLGEARSSYFHNSMGGYHGAKLRRYQDLFDSCLYRETQKLYQDLRAGAPHFDQYGAMNMLNARYLTFGTDENAVLPNPEANGNAWFVKELLSATSPADELNKVCMINTRDQAVLDISKFKAPVFQFDSTSSINLIQFRPNYIKYESQSSSDGFAVFSEIYYPKGWHAFLDGVETSIYRVDYVLRGLSIPTGKHSLEFKFEPEPYTIGNKITRASSWILVLVVAGAIGIAIRQPNQDRE
jgi:hypothetical protein